MKWNNQVIKLCNLWCDVSIFPLFLIIIRLFLRSTRKRKGIFVPYFLWIISINQNQMTTKSPAAFPREELEVFCFTKTKSDQIYWNMVLLYLSIYLSIYMVCLLKYSIKSVVCNIIELKWFYGLGKRELW